MKRQSENPWRGGRDKAARRQDPVSCQFCRTKKLKCDRAQPCSNCRSRGISCIAANASAASQATVLDSSDDTTPVDRAREQSIGFQRNLSLVDIDARLRRVEQIVLINSPSRLPDRSDCDGKPPDIRNSVLTENQQAEDAQKHEQEGLGDDEELSKRALILENAAISQNLTSPWGPADDTTAFLMTNEMFIEKLGATLLVANLSGSSGTELTISQLLSGLPAWKDALTLFEHYVTNVNWIYHIIHVPSVRRQMETMYVNIEAAVQPNTAHLALIYAILSLSAYFGSSSSAIPFAGIEGKIWSRRWSSFTIHALADDRKSYPVGIETLQTVILLSTFLLPNMGASALNMTFVGMTVSSARMLGLHQIDSNISRKDREKNGYNVVDLEVRRRIWWYITSSDWILSYMSGPQIGTYSVNPKHMGVLWPSNLDDAALTSSECNDLPLSVPTEMSYFIFRIKGAQLFREIVDAASESKIPTDDLDYDSVLAFDRKFNVLINDLPVYFKLDENSQRQSSNIVQERPYIGWQRTFMHFGYHTRLARLHRPYLARGSRDPQYAYSRMICLRSSRTVIEIVRNMHDTNPAFGPGSGQIWIITHHLFVAIVVLVMDLTFNQNDPQAKERKDEVLECCRLLEKSSEDSAIARQGVEELKKILKDWKQKTNESRSEKDFNSKDMSMFDSRDRHIPIGDLLHIPSVSGPAFAIPDTSGLADNAMVEQAYGLQDLLPESFEFDPNYDYSQWGELFQGLETYSESFE